MRPPKSEPFTQRLAAHREADGWFDGSVSSIDRRLAKCSTLLATAQSALAGDHFDQIPIVAELTAEHRALTAVRDDLLNGASGREAGDTPLGRRLAKPRKPQMGDPDWPGYVSEEDERRDNPEYDDDDSDPLSGWKRVTPKHRDSRRMATPVPALSAEPTDDERARTDATHRYIQQRYPDLEDTPGEGHVFAPGQRDDPNIDPDFAPNIIPHKQVAPPPNTKLGPPGPSHALESSPNLVHDIPTSDSRDISHRPNLDADSDQYWKGDQSTVGHTPASPGQMSLFNETPHNQLPGLQKYLGAHGWTQADYDAIDDDDGWGGHQPSGDIDGDDGWGPGRATDGADAALMNRLHEKNKAHGWTDSRVGRWMTLESAKFARENTDAIHDRTELAERAVRHASTLGLPRSAAEDFAVAVAAHARSPRRQASAPVFTNFPDEGLFL